MICFNLRLRSRDRLLDQCGHCSRLRYVDRMTARDLDHRGARALRHRALCRRRDHPVFRRDQIPAGLALPGRLRDRAVECGDSPRNLRVGEEGGLLGVEIRREGRSKLRLVEEQPSILRRKDRRYRRTGRRILDQRRHRLAAIRGECGDVHERGDLRVVARFGDHDPTIGMSDEDDRTLLRREDELRGRDIVGQRRGRVLDDGHAVTVLLQDVVDALPTRAVHEAAVHEHDGHPRRRR